MPEVSTTDTPQKRGPGKWKAVTFVVALMGAFWLFQTTQQWADQNVKTQPLMDVHDSPVALGEVAFETPDGRTLTMADFKGQYVLVNAWATWCPPCRKEMPSLEKLQTFFSGNKKFRVIALSVDEVSFDQLRAFYGVLGITTMALYRGDQDEVMQAFGIRGFPTSFLLNPEGKEIARLVGPTYWDNQAVIGQLRQLLAGPNAPMGAMN